MCGFVGIVREHKWAELHSPTLRQMTDAMAHRGPDDEGYYRDEDVMLGFRRLSIIDLDGGAQPMRRGQYVIVFNGEIYNYKALRSQLEAKGYSFATTSDTEVILALFEEFREKAVQQLRGMFSFIIYDVKGKTVFGARDPFGIKPLYYKQTQDFFFVASESKSILGSDAREKLSVRTDALQDYFTFQYVPEGESMAAKIDKVPPGHYFWKKRGEPINLYRYWRPVFQANNHNEEQLKQRLLTALKDSVSLHLESDVSVGAFLSGGIDSTAIVALAKELNPNLKTFSVGFKKQGYSEVDVAERTADILKVEHHHYLLDAEEVMKELPKIIYHLDEPVADPAAVPLYFVAREASKQVKVVLSGEGADELFAGYRIYQEPLFLRPLASLPEPLKKVLKRLAHLLPDRLKGKSYLLRGCTPLEKRYVGNAKLFEETEKANLLIQYCPCSHYQRVTKTLYEEAKHQGYDPVTTMQYIDINTWLVGDILVKADRMSMAHSLELRVPYLDQQVFEVAAEVHPRLKVTRQTSKWLLRQALKGVVPDHVINRPKLGFPVPIRHWLKNEWYEWARQLILESDTHHLLNKQMVLQMLDAHRKGFFDTGGQRWTSSKGRQDYSRQLWAVITFILWHQIFVEQRYAWARPGLEKESVGHRKANAL